MYCKFFGLSAKPFAITPDPRFLYLSDRHREALAHLVYGIGEGGGFVQLTGEVGTGKTTVCRALLDQLPEHVDIALILNPKLSARELVATICDELCIPYQHDGESIKSLIDALNRHLLDTHAAGRRTVLIIDEAQNLSAEVLEQVRLLTNLETARDKLLQIILIGQPELRELLQRRELRQLAQRVTARYHLEPLDKKQLQSYIVHRLRTCGGNAELFSAGAIEEIQRYSKGVPRLINVLCDRALLGAYVEEKHKVDKAIVRKAASEVLPEQHLHKPARPVWRWAAVGLPLLLAAWWWFMPVADQAGLHPARTSTLELNPTPDAVAALALTEPESVLEQSTDAAPSFEPEPASTPVVEPASEFVEVQEVPLPQMLPVDLRQRLLDLPPAGNGSAWQEMFARWGMASDVMGSDAACTLAEQEGLRCLTRNGNWTHLRGFNRPAVLELVAPDGRLVLALLDKLESDQAHLVVGGEVLRLPLAAVEPYWFGTYTLLWQPPLGAGLIRPGERGAAVLWLRERLDLWAGSPGRPASEADVFDEALLQRVLMFQAERQLRTDGIVGVQTILHLNALQQSSDTPTLAPWSS